MIPLILLKLHNEPNIWRTLTVEDLEGELVSVGTLWGQGPQGVEELHGIVQWSFRLKI